MQIKIKKNIFETMIINIRPYIEKKDASSITSHILIEAKEGNLKLQATDYDIGLNYSINDIEIQEEGFATANGKKLLNIIMGLKDEDVVVKTKGNDLLIEQKDSKFKIPMFNYEDFPEFPTLENKKKFIIDSQIFSRNIKKISDAIDTNNANYALNGALIDIKEDYISLVGTDTKRLSIFKIESQNKNEENRIIIPKKAISEIQKTFNNSMEIYYDENYLIAISQEYQFFTKLINSRFPVYERIIPSEFKEIVTLPRDEIYESIKIISKVCEKVKIIIRDNKIIFEGISDDNLEAKTEMDYNLDISEEIMFCTNHKYLTDFLNNIENSEFTMKFNGSQVPILFENKNLITIIMPTII